MPKFIEPYVYVPTHGAAKPTVQYPSPPSLTALADMTDCLRRGRADANTRSGPTPVRRTAVRGHGHRPSYKGPIDFGGWIPGHIDA